VANSVEPVLGAGHGAYLLRRRVAQTMPEHNLFVNWFFYLWVLYPVGLIAAAILHPSLQIGWDNVVLLLVGELVFPLISICMYRANQEIDAGLFSIISNLAPVVTIITAWVLLHERLFGHQLLGAVLVVASAFVATLPKLLRRTHSSGRGVFFALLSTLLIGLGVTYERFMLSRVEFGAYLVYGWGAQALWMTILAWPQRKKLALLKQPKIAKLTIALALMSTFQGLCFVAALNLSGNASIVSVFRSFLSVLIVLSAYYVLKERGQLALKISAAGTGVAGLILLNIR